MIDQSSATVPDKRLLASIHDVGPGFAREVDQLADLLAGLLGSQRFAMLVVPDHWGRHPLSSDREFQGRVRSWADAGIEMFVHGWFHRDSIRHSGMQAFKARHMTAREGEFLGLSEEVALQRMRDGQSLLEDIIGRPASGFVAPAWLYGAGALSALRKSGLPLAEDHLRVWDTASGTVLARGPVITWASRSSMRTASSLGAAALGRLALRTAPIVRVAIHPGDVTKESILTSIARTVRSFRRTHGPAAYRDLRNRTAGSEASAG